MTNRYIPVAVGKLYSLLLVLSFYLISLSAVIPSSAAAETTLEALSRAQKVKVSYYDITGSNLPELRESLLKLGPRDERGVARYASTKWYIKWSWPRKDGKPDFAQVQVNCAISVLVPRWNPPANVASETAQAWQSMLNALEQHEIRHVKNALNNFEKISTAIKEALAGDPALSEEQAEKHAQREISRIRVLDWELDAKTSHGFLEGVTL